MAQMELTLDAAPVMDERNAEKIKREYRRWCARNKRALLLIQTQQETLDAIRAARKARKAA